MMLMKARWITLGIAALFLGTLLLAGCVIPAPQVVEKPVTVVVIVTPTPIPIVTSMPSPMPATPTPATHMPSPMPTKSISRPTPTLPRPEDSIVLVEAIWPLLSKKGGDPIVGTGIIYSEEGLVLTAAHVVDGASVIKVHLPGSKRPLSARLRGVDSCEDLAMLEVITGGPFVPAAFGSSENIKPGDRVRVYGYPDNAKTGDDFTLTGGIVSRVDDEGTTILGLTYYDLIKTDARISRGNSGGPLIAWDGPDKGKVIGVVQLGVEKEVIGWAVPVDKRRESIENMSGGSKENWLGALTIPLEEVINIGFPGISEMLEAVEIPGLLVLGVHSGSPAYQVGLKSGDILVSMKDIDVSSMDMVCDILRSHNRNELLPIRVARGLLEESEEMVILEGQIDLEGKGNEKKLHPISESLPLGKSPSVALASTPTPTPLFRTLTPTPTPIPKSFPSPRGLLAYTVTETFRQHYRIELINTDGSGHRVLVDMASEPSFSPDGRQVVFYSWPGGLEVMNLDGSNRHRIVHDVEAAFPAWSPDGKYIAFHSVRGRSSRFNIYIVNADGTGERMLVDGEQAAWSPDSSRLVYKGCEGSQCGLMIINADGTGKRRLTTCNECANDGNPDWSRDTNRIVFTSERDGNHEIYVMNPDGSGQTRLTHHPGPDALPVWLPGGRQIAFRSFRDGQWGIYIMNADGTGVHKLTDARVDPNRWIWEKMAVTALQ